MTPPPPQPGFVRTAGGVFRCGPSRIYYALVKRHSKQFRLPLNASNRLLANRTLVELGKPITRLEQSNPAGNFDY